MLPLDFEVLVAPGNIDMARLQISAILANLRDMESEAAAHSFTHGLANGGLRLTHLCPIALDHLVAMLNFDECAPGIVARAPNSQEFLSWFERPIRRGEKMRNLDGQFCRRRIQHLDRPHG